MGVLVLGHAGLVINQLSLRGEVMALLQNKFQCPPIEGAGRTLKDLTEFSYVGAREVFLPRVKVTKGPHCSSTQEFCVISFTEMLLKKTGLRIRG